MVTVGYGQIVVYYYFNKCMFVYSFGETSMLRYAHGYSGAMKAFVE